MTTLYRYNGTDTDPSLHLLSPLNGGADLVLGSDPDPDPDPDIGVPGDRPALTSPPDETNTGPRQGTVQTLTGAQALTQVLSAPVESDGKRYLRRAQITSTITFNSSTHSDIVFEDCEISHGGSYTINAFYDGSNLPAGDLPEFRFCEISGGSASTFAGCSTRFIRCNMHRGEDIIKAREVGGEFYACYLHDPFHGPDSHCDVVQIVSAASGLLLHWNNMVAINAPDSPSGPGGWSNGVLQTGSATRPIGPVRWYDNWFDGGGYTIRTGAAGDLNGHAREYVFRRNKFGRNSRWGPVIGPTSGGVDWDASNVWVDTGLPVVD